MKKCLSLLLLCALLLSLTACSRENSAAGETNRPQTGTDGGVMSGGSDRPGDDTGATGNRTESWVENAGDAMENGIDKAKDALEGTASQGGVSYDQMLNNARVHDRDGDLKDGENALSTPAKR